MHFKASFEYSPSLQTHLSLIFFFCFLHRSPPVSFEEIGLGHVLPPHGRLDALGRHAVAKLGDVPWVVRLQLRVLVYPELLSCVSGTNRRNE